MKSIYKQFVRHVMAILICGTCCCLCSYAGASGASIWWPGWRISSSEELYDGTRYSYHDEVGAPAYPLSRLFDGNPNTAWVYSATSAEWDKQVSGSRYGIKLEPDAPILLDGLRIMNGHNESLKRFLKNNRALEIRVTLELKRSTLVRNFKLPDALGWHAVSFPAAKAKSISIEFTHIANGPAGDLCISELELQFGGRKIDMHMPKAVMFVDGLEACVPFYLILPNGQMLNGTAAGDGFADSWSPSGRYVSGIAGPDVNLWFADAIAGRMISDMQHLPLSRTDRKWVTERRREAKMAAEEDRQYGE